MSALRKEKRALIPQSKGNSKDVLVLVDGSKYAGPDEFKQEKQLCVSIAAMLEDVSQMAIVQFGSQTKLESPLTTNIKIHGKLEVQVSGSPLLSEAFLLCSSEFKGSKISSNAKQIWIFMQGPCEDEISAVRAAQKLKEQATIFAIGIGSKAKMPLLQQLASAGCSFVAKDFRSAQNQLKFIKTDLISLAMDMKFPNARPYKLGEEVSFVLEIENMGLPILPKNCHVTFAGNDYFQQKSVDILRNVPFGESETIEVTLIPKAKTTKAGLESLMLALPECIEVQLRHPDNGIIKCDSTGFLLSPNDFAGDIVMHKPVCGAKRSNIILFGPMAGGKSSFVNSVCSSLGEQIVQLNVQSSISRGVTTSSLLQFPLELILPDFFGNINLFIYDIPGLDGKNYKGDELAMLLHGLIPVGFNFSKQEVTFSEISKTRSSEQEELERRVHVVAVIIPQEQIEDMEKMSLLADFFYQITITHRRKVVVLISKADEIESEEIKQKILSDVCHKLAIDSSNVFFFQNYVATREKDFTVDKAILRILLAILSRADQFHILDKLNKGVNPFQRVAVLPQLAQQQPQQLRQGLAAILAKLSADLRKKLRDVMDEEGIDDEDTFRLLQSEDWKMLGFKMGETAKIMNASK